MLDRMKFAVVIAVLCFAPINAQCQVDTPPDILTGPAQIVDVDTIRIDGTKLRFWGIDGPGEHDRNQPNNVKAYDAEASDFLKRETSGQAIECHLTGKKSYDRFMARCYYAATGQDLSAHIVASGYAVDDPKYSNGYYSDYERRAKEQRLGFWRTISESWK